ncbi:MAG TPA: pilus assembly protein TadG-related protein [Tepidisphaeraceae bacterium]|jgi:Flp pilus assembly protein TadG
MDSLPTLFRFRPPARHRTGCRRTARRLGSAMIWAMVFLVPLTGIISLAVDWGYTQMVRSQMQNSADNIALGVIDAYIRNGWNGATSAAAIYPADNRVDSGSSVTPTVVITGGSWTDSTRSFAANVYTGTPAVRVTVTCTKANNNAVRLTCGALIGINTVDVKVTAIAVRAGGETAALAIPSRANLHLAGMPDGTSTAWGDDTADATPYQVTSIPVIPGQWMSFTGFSGNSSIYPAGGLGYYDASGNSAMPLHHGQNWNGSPNSPGPENGIADAIIPASAVTGLFLTDDLPSDNLAPATKDWTQPAVKDQVAFDGIQPQQPFMVGDGLTSGGAVQKFRVPDNATRLFLCIWDGVQQNNNAGTVSGNVQCRYYPKLVR